MMTKCILKRKYTKFIAQTERAAIFLEVVFIATITEPLTLKVHIGHFQSIKTDVLLNFLKTTDTIQVADEQGYGEKT